MNRRDSLKLIATTLGLGAGVKGVTTLAGDTALPVTWGRQKDAIYIRLKDARPLTRVKFAQLVKAASAVSKQLSEREGEAFVDSVHMDRITATDVLFFNHIGKPSAIQDDSILGHRLVVHDPAEWYRDVCEVRFYPRILWKEAEQRDFFGKST